jgi:chromosome segregation ATPase
MLRLPTEVPGKRGFLGEIGYAISSAIALRNCRRELEWVEGQLKSEREERRERQMEVARQAIGDPTLDISVVLRAREVMAEIEDRRSRKAGAAAASESEIESVLAEREREATRYREQLAEVDKELADIARTLEPRERKLAEARRRAGELKGQLRVTDDRIKKVQAELISARGATSDPVEAEADLAALRAEREAIASEEPGLAERIAALEPEIAGLKASRAELDARRDEMVEREKEAQVRIGEKIAALRARKTVDDREVADVFRERNSALRELGETLHEERVPVLEPRLRGIDEHDAAIATLERRAIELKDKMLRVDHAAMWRGFTLLMFVIVGVVAAVTTILLTL